MKVLKSITKRSAILLICMVLLFGNLFIPSFANPLCIQGHGSMSFTGYIEDRPMNDYLNYCNGGYGRYHHYICNSCGYTATEYWGISGKSIAHDFPNPIPMWHVACKNGCGATKCVGSGCLQCN